MNAFIISATNDELYDMVIQMAQGKLDRIGVAEWLRDRLAAVD